MATLVETRVALITSDLPHCIKGVSVDDAVLYLGAWTGPGASKKQFGNSLVKFRAAVKHILAFNAGLAASIPIHNMVAHSCLAWIVSLVRPGADVFEAADKAIHTLIRGLWQKIPTNLLASKNTPLPQKVKLLRATSSAGRLRAALKTSFVFPTMG